MNMVLGFMLKPGVYYIYVYRYCICITNFFSYFLILLA